MEKLFVLKNCLDKKKRLDGKTICIKKLFGLKN
jgi:hypothetical protein